MSDPHTFQTSRPLVPIMEAASLAGVSRRTIYNWIRDGKVQYIRTAGGSVRIYLDTLFQPGTTEGSSHA